MKLNNSNVINSNYKQLLDSNNWEAGYFISEKEFDLWTKRSRNLNFQLLQSARETGFTFPGGSQGDLMNATIPGCDKTVLLENNMITNPYYGRNLEHSSWSEKRAWAFRRTFQLDDELKNSKQIRIHFDGIDYQAMIFLNNNFIGSFCGMFRQIDVDVTRMINRDGDNLLALVFEVAPDGLPNHQDHDPADFAKFHRVQCGFGWDWSRKIIPTGIWDSVYLLGSNEARIKDFSWKTNGKTASVALEIEALNPWQGEVKLNLTPLNFEGKSFELMTNLDCKAGSNLKVIDFEFADAQLWYPLGYGKPNLYTLTMELDSRVLTHQVGFRDIKMVRNPDSPEGAYDLTFQVNGQNIFARGANWVPVDLIPSQTNDVDYDNLVQLATIANFNIFRIWGGGLIEKKGFYEACDKYGILVWQEFPHACSNYPKDGEYIAIKEKEAEGIVRKLRNHASICLFCGGNETQYYGEVPNSPLLLMYERIVKEYSCNTVFHTTSPDASRPGERPHGPWNFLDHSFYNTHFRQLASEIGCNGLCEAESIDKFIPANEIIPRGQSFLYHFMNQTGAHDVKVPLKNFSLEEGNRWQWSQASMFAQADAAGYIFEHYRRLYPYSSGCFFWQYNEPWPTLSWSLVDYYRTPKRAMYRLAKANAPRSFSIEDDSWILKDGKFNGKVFFVTNTEGFEGVVTCQLVDGAGNLLAKKEWNVNLPAQVSEVGNLEADCSNAAHNIVLAVIKAVDKDGNEIFRADRIYGVSNFNSAFALPKASVKFEHEIVQDKLFVKVTNTSNTPIFSLRLQCDAKVCWQDNYQSFLPGEEIKFEAQLLKGNNFSDNETIKLTGWNI